jgi:hypothetical protein
MRLVSPFIAAGLALVLAAPAFASSSPSSPAGGPASQPTTSQAPDTDANPAPSTQPASPPTASEPSSPSAAPSTAPSSEPSAAPSAQGSGAPASATAQSAAPASFTVGEAVKDNTGASIGTISSLTGSGATQMAVIKMGDQSFQVQSSKLGSADGAAEINMTKAQIAGMLHSSAK